MYFNKIPHIENFDFAGKAKKRSSFSIGKERMTMDVQALKDGVFRITPASRLWPKNHAQSGLTPPPPLKKPAHAPYRIEITEPYGYRIVGPGNQALLSSPSGMTFGVSGHRSVFVFEQTADMKFYGMGEKMKGIELSGIQTKFWNTDIFADFHWNEIACDRPDPMYASVPYMIIKRGDSYIGLLLNNPHATFMSTSAAAGIGGGQMILSNEKRTFLTIGAQDGMPELFILVGPTLPELTRKFQKLVGVTPLPPAWALGYHQCRWGYKSDACLEDLDRNFTRHRIPCDGLWVDIDYMDSFKVFTFNKDYFPSVDQTLKKMADRGRKVVPIIDPGVKKQKGYPVYDSGRRADVFCKNYQGKDFVGLVWPGETVFPDFSTAAGRRWWAGWVKKFARHGFHGAWLDMNDPSTGPVLNEDMLFNKGRDSHDTYHNQYALGMAQASREGFQAARPGQRPFLLSRSGFTGISKYAALWTGDNMSNYHYLRNCIAVSLNLALSGVPFNGPDIGGFAGDATPQLISDWMKTCFLFPFCRNHSMIGTRRQEPWAFDAGTTRLLKHFIQMRYALRPYLYNLFIQQEEEGEALLRPLFYDFTETESLPLGHVDDAFMVGPAILQAPLLNEQERKRDVPLPGAGLWFSVMDDTWVESGLRTDIAPGPLQTPMFLREGHIIPTTPSLPEDNGFKPEDVTFHIMLHRASTTTAAYSYAFDDGATYDYRKGKRTILLVTASVQGGVLDIRTDYVSKGYGPCRHRFIVHDDFNEVRVDGRKVAARKGSLLFAGSRITVRTTAARKG